MWYKVFLCNTNIFQTDPFDLYGEANKYYRSESEEAKSSN